MKCICKETGHAVLRLIYSFENAKWGNEIIEALIIVLWKQHIVLNGYLAMCLIFSTICVKCV